MLLEDGGSNITLQACISSRICAHADVYDLVTIQDNIQNSNSESSTTYQKRGKPAS
jgi:hypothetical protein